MFRRHFTGRDCSRRRDCQTALSNHSLGRRQDRTNRQAPQVHQYMRVRCACQVARRQQDLWTILWFDFAIFLKFYFDWKLQINVTRIINFQS